MCTLVLSSTKGPIDTTSGRNATLSVLVVSGRYIIVVINAIVVVIVVSGCSNDDDGSTIPQRSKDKEEEDAGEKQESYRRCGVEELPVLNPEIPHATQYHGHLKIGGRGGGGESGEVSDWKLI